MEKKGPNKGKIIEVNFILHFLHDVVFISSVNLIDHSIYHLFHTINCCFFSDFETTNWLQ